MDDLTILNPSFNLLGYVVQGMEVLEVIEQVDTAISPGTRENSLPLESIYIEDVVIEVSGP
jgi:cyclophilin family peptidyl-prolyl cis-trans isomerase